MPTAPSHHGVGVVVKEEDLSQAPPTGEGSQPKEPSPASQESSTAKVADVPIKEEVIDSVAKEEDATALEQPTETGKLQPLAGDSKVKSSSSTPIDTSKVNEQHIAVQEPRNRKDKISQPSIPSDGLVQSPSSPSIQSGKLVLEYRTSQLSESNFPRKLYDILANPENHHAISWMPHGRAWKVRQKDVFMRTVCPKYFSQSKFESFIRQANGWGFRRMRREGPDRNAYYHELFLRGKPELMEGMKRPQPGEKAAQLVMDPDFYNMPPMPSMPNEFDQSLSKQVSFASPTNYGSNKKRKKESKSPRVQSQASPGESPFSNTYGSYVPYDSQWQEMPPPPPPYAYSQAPDYGGYGMPPPPPPPPPEQGWHQPTSPSNQNTAASMHPPSASDIPPFDPSYYFPPYYTPYVPPPSQMTQGSNQDQTDGSTNDASKMNLPPDSQSMPPPPPQYPNYPSYPPPPPHASYPSDMPYYPPPGDMPYVPPPDGHYNYQIGSVPPHPHVHPQGNAGVDPNLERKDSFQFSPIQHPSDE